MNTPKRYTHKNLLSTPVRHTWILNVAFFFSTDYHWGNHIFSWTFKILVWLQKWAQPEQESTKVKPGPKFNWAALSQLPRPVHLPIPPCVPWIIQLFSIWWQYTLWPAGGLAGPSCQLISILIPSWKEAPGKHKGERKQKHAYEQRDGRFCPYVSRAEIILSSLPDRQSSNMNENYVVYSAGMSHWGQGWNIKHTQVCYF